MYNVGVSHELLPGTSVTAEWFHSDFKNLIARNNVARTAADYTLINVASPIDGSVIPYYNVSTAKQSAVNNVDSTDPNLTRSYNGLEINVNTRLPHGVRVFGGTSTEKTISNSCSAATNDPNLLLFCDGSKNNIPWITAGQGGRHRAAAVVRHHRQRRLPGARRHARSARCRCSTASSRRAPASPRRTASAPTT